MKILTDAQGKVLSSAGKAYNAEPFEPNNVEWHQCPQAVRNYLDQVTYDPSDYSTSRIAEFAPATAVTSNTKPIGKTVDGVTYYNEVPNVETPFSSENTAGTLKPLDRLRWIEAGEDSQGNPFCKNMRDLGGWQCDGGTVKYGLLYRCGQPSKFARNVLVDRLGVHCELDLQGQDSERTDSILGADVQYCRPSRYQWYTIADKVIWREIVACIFHNVKYGNPTIFHCSAGADRTGTVACVIEAILGISQSDIDKDYELTSFYSGTDTDAHSRRRNETEWSGLIDEIKAVPLVGGLNDTFRNRAVSFVLSLGFGIDEINAFRDEMTNGSPSAITVSLDNYTVTNNLTNASSDNSATSVAEYSKYEATITPSANHKIKTAQVLMGVTDISNAVVVAEFLPAQKGIVKIPIVTGNIVISLTAEEEVLPYHNLINSGTDENKNVIGYTANKRVNSSGLIVASQSGYTQYCTYYIPLSDVAGDAAGVIIRLRNIPISRTMDNVANYNVCLCSISNGTVTNIISTSLMNSVFDPTNHNPAAKIYNAVFNSDTGRLEQFAIGTPSAAATHFAFTIPVEMSTNMIITVNEEIV